MKRLNYTVTINAPVKKVWHSMLDDEPYRVWTDVFASGSHYVGDWNKDSKIHFLAPDEDGNVSGMVSRIDENRPYEYISIEHLGIVADGKEDTTSQDIEGWAGAFENYTFRDLDGKTEVLVEMDVEEEHMKMFEDMWPEALQKLKSLAEER